MNSPGTKGAGCCTTQPLASPLVEETGGDLYKVLVSFVNITTLLLPFPKLKICQFYYTLYKPLILKLIMKNEKRKEKRRSLQRRGSYLAQAAIQVAVLDDTNKQVARFEDKLEEHAMYPLRPTGLDILQINLGYMCNLTCEHCHVDAGPTRKEIMNQEVMQHCLTVIQEAAVRTVDLTGGAPEMNPYFQWFVEEIRKISPDIDIIVRSNLTILVSNRHYETYPAFFQKHRLSVIASLPCYTESNTDKQRGDGVFVDSIRALRVLNALGYGKEGTGLQLHLVYNPGGAFLPGSQEVLQADYKRVLANNYDLAFNNLYTITNLPISRFLDYLLQENKLNTYMELLVNSFNIKAAHAVMCRNTLSVSWDGYLYDCDFNQMLQLPVGEKTSQHLRNFNLNQLMKRSIVMGQHCYGCTAGAGSSCQGSLNK